MSEIAMTGTAAGEKFYRRFIYYHRFLHVLIMVSFLGLVMTGMPLKYSDAQWAKDLAVYLGGFEFAGIIHRVCGAITFGYFILHLAWAAFWLAKKRPEKSILAWAFGPNSMVPRVKDGLDIVNHFRWFMGKGPKPEFDRFTYWEKFDYLAVFWGVGMIGISGLFLWFPVFFANFLPGWAFNLATIGHSDEALLAAGFIFTIHFFNTHLRPQKFPLDHVIFTGVLSEHEFKEERPLEYKRLVESGRLESLRAPAPTRMTMIWSHIVGILAYVVGLVMIILILYAAIMEVFGH